MRSISNEVVALDSKEEDDWTDHCRKLRVMNIPKDSSTTGEVVEVGTRDCDIGTLRRDLNKIGERVEEVAELRVLNEKGLGSREA